MDVLPKSDYVGRNFAENVNEDDTLDDNYGVKDYIKKDAESYNYSEASTPRKSEKEEKVIYVMKSEQPEKPEPFFTDSLAYLFAVSLIFLTIGYFYWVTAIECNVEAKDETNMTINYAIDQMLLLDE